MISELTYKIVAFSEIEQLNPDDSIDWAIDMLELGHESPFLLMLASFNKPSNYFEVKEYVTAAINEIGLKPQSGDAAIFSYASYHISQMAKGKEIRKNLTEVYNVCTLRDYEESVHDFYLLYWAWDSLDYDENFPNAYWEEADKDNIQIVVQRVAKEWIEKNKKNYTQQEL